GPLSPLRRPLPAQGVPPPSPYSPCPICPTVRALVCLCRNAAKVALEFRVIYLADTPAVHCDRTCSRATRGSSYLWVSTSPSAPRHCSPPPVWCVLSPLSALCVTSDLKI